MLNPHLTSKSQTQRATKLTKPTQTSSLGSIDIVRTHRGGSDFGDFSYVRYAQRGEGRVKILLVLAYILYGRTLKQPYKIIQVINGSWSVKF